MNNSDLIVVGVDGTEGGRHALRWAIAKAGGPARVEAVRWRGPGTASNRPSRGHRPAHRARAGQGNSQ